MSCAFQSESVCGLFIASSPLSGVVTARPLVLPTGACWDWANSLILEKQGNSKFRVVKKQMHLLKQTFKEG